VSLIRVEREAQEDAVFAEAPCVSLRCGLDSGEEVIGVNDGPSL
jgi:hypothetical protein